MSGFKVNFSVNNQLATPAIHAAALVNRPAAGQPGRVFIDTDNPSTGIYRDTGTAWLQIAGTGGGGSSTLQNVTDNGNTTDNTLILTYDSLFNGSNAIEFFDTGTTATRYSITKQGTGNRLTLQGNSPLSTNDMGLMIDAPNNTLRTYWGSSFNSRGISCDFTNNIYRLGNISGTAGEQGIYINSSGNVGIGSTNPTSKITINQTSTGEQKISFQLSGTEYGYLTTNTSSGNVFVGSDQSGYRLNLRTGATSGGIRANNTIQLNTGVTTGTSPKFDIEGTASMFINWDSPSLNIDGPTNAVYSMRFNTGGSERMRIFGNGNVVVGRTSDNGVKFQVQGGIDITGTMNSSSIGTGTIASTFLFTNGMEANTGNMAIRTNLASSRTISFGDAVTNLGANEYMRFFPSNTIPGIGTGSTELINIQPTINQTTGTGTIYGIRFKPVNTAVLSTVYSFYADSGNAYFGSNVGINAITPAARLHLNGTLRIDGQSSGTAGGSSGLHLIVNLDGTNYKIALLNA